MLRVGGCFSGIGGMELGLTRAGYQIQWLIEEHLWRRNLLKQRFQGADIYSDIRFVEPPWTDLKPIDLICGGFPCQGTSQAGKRAGLADPRSGLWLHFARLIATIRPKYVIIENVSGLRSRGMGAILADLSALGYDAEWESIPARAFGSPQRRDRVFIVGWRRNTLDNGVSTRSLRTVAHTRRLATATQRRCSPLDQQIPDPNPSTPLFNTVVSGCQPVPDAVLQCCPEQIFCVHSLAAFAAYCRTSYWPLEPRVGRVADGLPARVDPAAPVGALGLDRATLNRRLEALGDSLIPQMTQYIGLRLLHFQS